MKVNIVINKVTVVGEKSLYSSKTRKVPNTGGDRNVVI